MTIAIGGQIYSVDRVRTAGVSVSHAQQTVEFVEGSL